MSHIDLSVPPVPRLLSRPSARSSPLPVFRLPDRSRPGPRPRRTLALALRGLSDRELLSRVKDLVSRERAVTLEILVHLIEVERRRLHVGLGYASMFEYCRPAPGLLRVRGGPTDPRRPVYPGLSGSPRAPRKERGESGGDLPGGVDPHKGERHGSVGEDPRESPSGRWRRSWRPTVRRSRCGIARSRCVWWCRERALPKSMDLEVNLLPPLAVKKPNMPPPASPAAHFKVPLRRKLRDKLAPTSPRRNQASVCASRPAFPPRSEDSIQFLASERFMRKFEKAKALLSNGKGDLSYEFVLEAALDEFLKSHDPEERNKRREHRREKAEAGPKSVDLRRMRRTQRLSTDPLPASTEGSTVSAGSGQADDPSFRTLDRRPARCTATVPRTTKAHRAASPPPRETPSSPGTRAAARTSARTASGVRQRITCRSTMSSRTREAERTRSAI